MLCEELEHVIERHTGGDPALARAVSPSTTRMSVSLVFRVTSAHRFMCFE
jgi:hypothetical protein